ncbi:MAG: nitroreductase [Saprospiraceae bacterium]
MNTVLTPAAVSALIRSRKSVFPAMYDGNQPIDKAIIEEMLENANWAPTHKKTEPWRFRVIRGEALKELAQAMGEAYTRITPSEKFSEQAHKKFTTNPTKPNTIIAIILKRDAEESLPLWEEEAALAMAVQNMWLTATAYGLGSFWSSPGVTKHIGEFLQLEEGESCYGLFYLSHYHSPEVVRERGAIADKVKWME